MHSPVRSEREVFWGVVATTVAVLAAIGIGVAAGMTAGVLVAVVLLAAGAWLLGSRASGSLPEAVFIAEGNAEAHRILVVANETIEGDALIGEIRRRRADRGRIELLLVSPSLARSRLDHLSSDIDAARGEAAERLQRSLAALGEAGVDARGVVGDEDPFVAATDALASFGADELIVSTHPPDRSRWLERGVVEQMRANIDLPVTHVIVDRTASPAGA